MHEEPTHVAATKSLKWNEEFNLMFRELAVFTKTFSEFREKSSVESTLII